MCYERRRHGRRMALLRSLICSCDVRELLLEIDESRAIDLDARSGLGPFGRDLYDLLGRRIVVPGWRCWRRSSYAADCGSDGHRQIAKKGLARRHVTVRWWPQ
jgi:hypothetical protein